MPEERLYEGWRFESFAHGADAVRRLVQDGPLPTVLRLSDEAETALNLARPSELGQAAPAGCLAIAGYEGSAEDVAARRGRRLPPCSEAAGATAVPGAGERWARDRYRGPVPARRAARRRRPGRDARDGRVLVGAAAAVRGGVDGAARVAAAQGTPPVVLCHISHVYASGASLYFTVACAQLEDPRRAMARRQGGRRATRSSPRADRSPTTTGSDATTSTWYAREIGELAIGALAAVKRELDPAGILNPAS